MGRAMLIICAGVLVSMGFVSMGTTSQGKRIIENNAGYAEFVQAKNRAHTAIQMAFQEINQDPGWADDHGINNKWTPTIEGQQVELYIDVFHKDTNFDSLRIYSSTVYGDETADIVSVYTRSRIDLVPTFKGAISLATNNFTFSMGGSSSVNGNDPTGGQCSDMPGVAVMDEDAQEYVENNATSGGGGGKGNGKNGNGGGGGKGIGGNPAVGVDSDLSYKPVDELIARLKDLPDVQKVEGNYKGSMGTKENPGVFFVEDYAKLTGGIDEGYGILVVRKGGEMAYEEDGAELDIAGNFKFNGLVIFENAYNFNGRGTPTINGNVLVGNTDNYASTIDIDVSGNLHVQYDCRGEEYANIAAANAFKQNRYQRVVTFE